MSESIPRSVDRRRCQGFSLVELMVGALIGVVIFIGWLKICNFQAIRKESLRREALERGAGMLDYMASESTAAGLGYYAVTFQTADLRYARSATNALVVPMFGFDQPVGYRLSVTQNGTTNAGWSPASRWAQVELFDRHGVTNPGRAFASLSVLIAP